MNRDHLSDDELVELLYGLGDPDWHLTGCAECSGRLSVMRKTRAAVVATPEINGPLLAAQRQRVLDRLERPALGWRWVPPVAAASLLAAALFLYHQPAVPQHVPQSGPQTVSIEADAELFTDVYAMERDVEPRAAAPIRSLFQTASFETPSEKEGQ